MKEIIEENPTWIKTGNTLVIYYPGEIFTLTKENNLYEKSLAFLKERNYKNLRSLLSPIVKFIEYTGGKLIDKDGDLYLEGDSIKIPEILGKKIREFSSEGLPFEPLINFWSKVKNNPEINSINQLYTFLELNHLPITPEGNLIAFKGVLKPNTKDSMNYPNNYLLLYDKFGESNVFWSLHHDENDKKIPNIIGEYVSMDRNKVVSDPKSHCSYGLHVGAFSYASTFISGSFGVVLEVEIDPSDVVSVPDDCSCQKMRVCKYKVNGILKNEIVKKNIVESKIEYNNKEEVKAIKKDLFNYDQHTAKEILNHTIKKLKEKNKKFNDYNLELDIKHLESILNRKNCLKNKKSIISKVLMIEKIHGV